MYLPLLDVETRRRRLTKHFSYKEMTATNELLPNHPDEYAFSNLMYTCRILESVRKKFGRPIPITSGYRSPEVNNNVGGDKNSYHLDGRAVDIDISSFSSGVVDQLESILWDYNPVELYKDLNKKIIHTAF